MPRTKTRRVKDTPSYGSFYFRVDDWNSSYSFSSQPGPTARGSYWDYMAITIQGACVSPKERVGRSGELIILGDRALEGLLRDDEEAGLDPLGVGTLTMRGQETSYLGSMPRDAMAAILPLLATDALKFVALSGDALYRGKAQVRSISFEQEVDPDDLL